MASNTTGVNCEGDNAFVGENLFEVLDSSRQLHATDGSGNFAAVFVVNADVGATGLDG